MCYTYDKSKGGDTRELQSGMVPPPPKKKLGRVTLNSFHKRVWLLICVYLEIRFKGLVKKYWGGGGLGRSIWKCG